MHARRVASIDVFRGLSIMVMIFVNELAGVHGLPWWTYHAHAQQGAITYVDMVFPFFLFIVGMSMPLAIERRLELNPSQRALWRHIALRALGLIVLRRFRGHSKQQAVHVVTEEATREGGLFYVLLSNVRAYTYACELPSSKDRRWRRRAGTPAISWAARHSPR